MRLVPTLRYYGSVFVAGDSGKRPRIAVHLVLPPAPGFNFTFWTCFRGETQ